MIRRAGLFALLGLWVPSALAAPAPDTTLQAAIARDYDAKLAPLFDYFHRNPELSYMEVKTAARLAGELREAGFEVTEKVGKTGVVAILKNGPGPLVMMRADMDGLPVQEKSGLANASKVVMQDQTGREVPVAHACGHDVHMTALVGAGRRMAAMKAQWKGTLMLIGQPAEERGGGARDMMADNIWQRFGTPDSALSLHVFSGMEAGKIDVTEAPYSGADTLEIVVRGVGTHGASPHTGKDPVVIGAQIVMALQTVVSRELSPREPGLITVGSFQAGSKANIISDSAKLELTVRSESAATRELLVNAVRRVALHTARAAGVPEDLLPQVRAIDDPVLPVLNDMALAARVKAAWSAQLGPGVFAPPARREAMVAEDFARFTAKPYIPSVYYTVGGTPAAELKAAQLAGTTVPVNHSPLFKVQSEASVKGAVATSVVALLEMFKSSGKQ